MIWIASMALAAVLVKLGMLLILVKLLFIGMKLSLFIIAGLVAVIIWRKFFQRRNERDVLIHRG